MRLTGACNGWPRESAGGFKLAARRLELELLLLGASKQRHFGAGLVHVAGITVVAQVKLNGHGLETNSYSMSLVAVTTPPYIGLWSSAARIEVRGAQRPVGIGQLHELARRASRLPAVS
jgi:hypothetical protein